MAQKYSRAFVGELQKRLCIQKKRIEKRINELKQDDPFSDLEQVNDNAAVDTDVREQVDHATVSAKIKELKLRLCKITSALEKIKKGGFGNCERCGHAIPKERLQVIPEEGFCIKCKGELVV